MTTTAAAPISATPADPAAGFEPSPGALRTAAEQLLSAMTEAGPDALAWVATGPLVSEAAHALREALGVTGSADCVFAPAIVREADFAHTCRLLLGAATVIDARAARRYLQLAHDAAVALS